MRRSNQRESYTPFDIIDAPTRNYIAQVSRVRNGALKIDISDSIMEFISALSIKILKGTYAYVNHNDYIQLDGHKRVPLSYSSSGQQEVVWLLNLLFTYAAIHQKSFVIIEEPETHLHPDAQYLLTQYIAAFRNNTSSRIFITTHSPYVLSSFNNLFYAGKCGLETANAEAVNSVIPAHCWLDAKDFSAYIMENASIRDIKDEELAMIDIAELDAVASKQDTEYEKLLNIAKGRHI